MASLTLKNISDDLMDQLRLVAERERRSITQQVLYMLEQSLVEDAARRVAAEADLVEGRSDGKEAP